MAYDPTVQQPQLVHATPTNRVYVYKSDDAVAAVSADDYFTDGGRLGMQIGDTVLINGANGGTATVNFAADPERPTNADNTDHT